MLRRWCPAGPHLLRLAGLVAALGALGPGAPTLAGGPEPAELGLAAPADLGCPSEAVVLTQALSLRTHPDPGAPLQARLGVGRDVYLCAQVGGFQAVRYPEEGDAVDCSRPDRARPCPIGWADVPAAYDFRG